MTATGGGGADRRFRPPLTLPCSGVHVVGSGLPSHQAVASVTWAVVAAAAAAAASGEDELDDDDVHLLCAGRVCVRTTTGTYRVCMELLAWVYAEEMLIGWIGQVGGDSRS